MAAETDKNKALARAKKLRKLIDYHRVLYHAFDQPEISDQAFDSLKNELEELENRFPGIIDNQSPTQKVGAEPLENFVKVKHEIRMLSFLMLFQKKKCLSGNQGF